MTERLAVSDGRHPIGAWRMHLVCLQCRAVLSELARDQSLSCPHCGALLPSPLAAPPTTTVEDSQRPPRAYGRYRVITRFASGNFAVVYRAHDEQLDRFVAVKVLRRTLLSSPSVREAFFREARILARMVHPGIVPIFDIGETSDGVVYLVTPFVQGWDLKTRLKMGRLPLAQGVEIVACVAEALDHAHRHGLVHRDVKPANILLEQGGQPLLVDFGLALTQEEFGTGPTDVGTPLYMSPEQARKEGHLADARSDIYSLGVVFYELLVGRHPFTGESLEELQTFIVNEQCPSPCQVDASIPGALEQVWRRATALFPVDRYDAARELAEDLRAWQKTSSR